MKIKKRSKLNKPLVSTVLLAVFALTAFLLFFVLAPQKSESEKAQSETLSTDKQQAENIQKNPDTKEEAPNTDHPADPIATENSTKKQVQMIASTDRSGDTVYIRGGINYPVTGGSCYAQLSGPSGQSIRKDSAVLSNPGSTDCKTIAIPTGELSAGKWKFKLHYASEEYEGVSNEISFTL